MNASVAIQSLPKAADDEELIRIVDQVIDYIKSTGLNYYVGPFETTIEGDYDQLMDIVKECQYIAVRAGAPSSSWLALSLFTFSFRVSSAAWTEAVFSPESGALPHPVRSTPMHREASSILAHLCFIFNLSSYKRRI